MTFVFEYQFLNIYWFIDLKDSFVFILSMHSMLTVEVKIVLGDRIFAETSPK